MKKVKLILSSVLFYIGFMLIHLSGIMCKGVQE